VKTIFCAALLLLVLIFLIPQDANAVTIDAFQKPLVLAQMTTLE